MKVRPYIFYKRDVIDSVKLYLSDQLEHWYLNWLGSVKVTQIDIYQGDEGIDLKDKFQNRSREEFFVSNNGITLAWDNVHSILKGLSGQSFFQPDVNSDLCQYLLSRAAQDLCEALCDIDPTYNESIFNAQSRGSGWLSVRVHASEYSLYLCFPSSIVKCIAERLQLPLIKSVSKSIASSQEACRKLSASLDIELVPIELTLEELLGIQVGDIIRLDHRVDNAALAVSNGKTLFKASLGTSGKFKAAKLAGLKG